MRALDPRAPVAAETVAPHVDFDLHGIVAVRLLEPTATDVRVVERQLGPLQRAGVAAADVTVRFVDRIEDDAPLTYVGYPESGFHDEAFYLLQGRHGSRARTLLDFADVGGRCAIVCERGVGAVPHLLSVVNFAALAKGVLPLHASAFVLDGLGVLACGWSKGGKTETLLAFAAHGAEYVGDEWVYLTPDRRMLGLPEPIRLWHWHLLQLPQTWAGLGRGARTRLAGLSTTADGARAMARRLDGRPGAASVLRRAEPVIRRQAFRQVPPQDLFGDRMQSEARLDTVLLLSSHDQATVDVAGVAGEEVARRMRASLAEERAAFMAHYRQFRFAFPDRSSDVVERANELERDLLSQALDGVPAHHVRHPYPFELESLVAPVAAVLDRTKTDHRVPHASTGNTGGTP